MRTRYELVLITLVLGLSARAQWKDRVSLGNGGEPKIATDGKGNVFATCHLPCKVYVSRDWGATFGEPFALKDAFCDVDVLAWPDGRVNLVAIKNGVSGLLPWYSTDSGAKFESGKGLDGPLDREWLACNPTSGEVYWNYSHGYIGGPKSKGIFLAASSDGGKTFVERSRIDKPADGVFAVDPYLANNPDGRLYAMWATSVDYNTVVSFEFASSSDGGRTFTGHQSLAEFDAKRGDIQERWMLGSLVSAGKDGVYMVYPDYVDVPLDGKVHKAFVLHWRASGDGGKTFSKGIPVTPEKELHEAIRSFAKAKTAEENFPYYIQTLPWLCSDPSGNVHLAFQDNRRGQKKVDEVTMGLWQVRFSSCFNQKQGFGVSEQVSEPFASRRPPLDFISCAADAKRVYVIWVETPDSKATWNFSGNLYVGRRILPKAPAP